METATIVKSQLEIIEQGRRFVLSTPEKLYRTTFESHYGSSPGKHIRHVLDHFTALQTGFEVGQIDYNKRHRLSFEESAPQAALERFDKTKSWLQELGSQQLNLPIEVVSEVSVSEELSITCQSTLTRELIFVGNHAVHHFSLIAVVLSSLGYPQAPEFGIAPATLSHMRAQTQLTG